MTIKLERVKVTIELPAEAVRLYEKFLKARKEQTGGIILDDTIESEIQEMFIDRLELLTQNNKYLKETFRDAATLKQFQREVSAVYGAWCDEINGETAE